LAKSALTQLAEQIEALRKDAYEAGYAAAMRAVRQFTGSSTAAVPSVTSTQRAVATTRRTVTKPQSRRSATTAPKPRTNARSSQLKRGNNAVLIGEVLKGMQGSARAADIRKALQRDKGVSIAFTSIRHALNQLAQRGEAEASTDRKTWRYVGTAASQHS
jgi:hypothetical protein